MVRVKICGITNLQDASTAVKLGADALGFVFAHSPRQITPENARHIIHALPPFVPMVGVFVDEGLTAIRDIVDFCGLDTVQLHGNESPELCHQLMPHCIKAFRLKDESSLSPLGLYQGHARALLLDTYQKGTKGGTGRAFDWKLAVKVREFGMPVILSGGLGPRNIQEAISTARPYAVDVNSGVESRPGKKDPILMKELMEAIRRMDRREVRG
jgi:phosphoribosylanthranilate isomerase